MTARLYSPTGYYVKLIFKGFLKEPGSRQLHSRVDFGRHREEGVGMTNVLSAKREGFVALVIFNRYR